MDTVFVGGKITTRTQTTNQTEELILWNPKKKLKWDDFKGKVDSLSQYDAITHVQFVKEQLKINSTNVVYAVSCNFDKTLSWSKDKESKVLLGHEQLHFDIAELVSRLLRKSYTKAIITSGDKAYDEINQLYDYYVFDYLDSINHHYDLETDHSVNLRAQREWENKIAKELKSLDKYANTRVVIKRVKKTVPK